MIGNHLSNNSSCRFIFIAGFFFCLGQFTAGQSLAQAPGDSALHLVSAIPTFDSPDSYNPVIYRVDRGGPGLKRVFVLDLERRGLDCIRADFRARQLVFASPRVVPSRLSIISMDNVATPRVVPLEFSDIPASAWRELPADLIAVMPHITQPSTRIIYSRHPALLDRPGIGGSWLALNVTSYRGVLNAGYRLDSESSRDILDPAALSGLRVQGDFGLASELGDSDATDAFVRDGKLFVGQIDIGVPAPAGANDPKSVWRVVAHDGHRTVMYRLRDPGSSNSGNGASRLYMRDGTSGEWRTVVVPGSKPRVKMIDSWAMGAAVSDDLGRESPGATERRRYQRRYEEEADRNKRREGRLATDGVFKAHKSYVPGVLFLIEARTGRYFEIRTGQGDSEILLVHNMTVYYRVNDSLFSAPIQGNSLGTGRLIARDDAMPDVHWAFWGS